MKQDNKEVLVGLICFVVGFVPIVVGFVACLVWTMMGVGWDVVTDLATKVDRWVHE